MELIEEGEDDYQSDFDEDGENEESFAKLHAAVSQLDSKHRIKTAKRNELGATISEYHVKGVKPSAAVKTKDLANVLLDKKGKSKTLKKITRESQAKTLPKPLEKPVAEKIKRRIGFELVKKQLDSWDAVVESNRVADNLVFPLNQPKLGIVSNNEFFSRFVTQTSLEKELNAVLHGPEVPQEPEEKDEFPLTLEELIERRKELAGIRAKQSYREAKAYRQSKIKSKKYHRIQKREKIKKQMKEFELLQKTDPEAALKKLDELEKNRAEERATLRHRSTGKWAQSLAVRAKYDQESRKVLAEQLAISRDMTMKAKLIDSSDDEAMDDNAPETEILEEALKIAKSNPWSLEVSSEVNSFINGFKKFQETNKDAANNTPNVEEVEIVDAPDSTPNTQALEEKSKEVSPKKSKRAKKTSNNKWDVSISTETPSKPETDFDIDDAFYVADQKLKEAIEQKFKTLKGKITTLPKPLKSKKTTNAPKPSLKMKNSRWHVERVEVDGELGDGNVEEVQNTRKRRLEEVAEGDKTINPYDITGSSSGGEVNIDPEVYLKIKPKVLKTAVPDDVVNGDEEDGIDEVESQEQVIMEAFADDNVTDFRKAKEAAEEETKPEVVAELPGWGSWGGAGLANAPKRRKRRFLQMKDLPARKDKNRPDIIVNENANPKIKEHMVKEVPFPFSSVDAFESNIRAPISREWIPELAHRALIKPSVITKQGTIIEPMSDDVLMRKKLPTKSIFKAKKKGVVKS